jgi:class 3 adenylate cyclase
MRVEHAEEPKVHAERRLITVLFCDLVGSTQLSTRLDAEEMREVILMYHKSCAREVERYGGYIAQYLGDGILVYFGYPEAHEDSPERAVLSALAMCDAVGRLSEESQSTWGLSLAVRVGVHSGVVVIGEIGGGLRRERLALGDAPNIAARIQAEATSGEVLISEATYKLAPGRFVVTNQGTPELKGVDTRLRLFLVVGVLPRAITAPQGRTIRTFGRDAELATLDEAWQAAQRGNGKFVTITAEAGLGKSHMLRAFMERITQPAVEIVCDELQSQTPLWPLSDWLLRSLDAAKLTPSRRRAALEADLERRGLSPDLLPGLCTLIGVSHRQSPVDPDAARAATTRAIETYLLSASGLIVCEDAHWADATTVEVLTTLAPKLAVRSILLVVTSRTELPWPDGVSPTQALKLKPLDRTAAEGLVRNSLNVDLNEKQIDLLVERADGMPLFLEELARSAEALGGGDEFDVPTSLYSVLMTRLDRAGTAKRIAQIGAVIGREFSRADLEAILLDSTGLQRGLHELERADILKHRMTEDSPLYSFRHALLQGVAYGSLLRKARAQIHRRIAVRLEEGLGAEKPGREMLGLLAYHFRRSLSERMAEREVLEKAVDYLLQAGMASLALSAYPEAETAILEAQKLTEQLENGTERWRRELRIHKELSVIHRATIGFAAPEVERDLRDARAVCERLGEQREMATVSLATWSLLLGRGAYADSLQIASEVLQLSRQIADQEIRLRALAACSNSEFWLGKLEDAFEHADTVIAEYVPEHKGAGLMEHGWDAGVHAYMVAIWSAWLLGRTDVLDYEARLQKLADEIGHPLTTAIAENTSCVLHVIRRDTDATIASADRLIRVAEEYGFPFYKMLGDLFRAEGLVRKGEGHKVFPAADQIFTLYQTEMGGLAQTFVASFMAVVYAAMGQRARALEVVRYALDAVERCNERIFEGTLRRQERLLSVDADPPLDELEICGALTEDSHALSSEDPRNYWIQYSRTTRRIQPAGGPDHVFTSLPS